MKPRHQRLLLIGGTLAILALAATFVLRALDSNIALYITPSDIAAGKAPRDRLFRIGGLVKAGSVQRDGLQQTFIVTDQAHDITVRYQGILPDLFRENKGVVAQGRLQPDGSIVASEVLAKHDENYMPPEAQHALDNARTGASR